MCDLFFASGHIIVSPYKLVTHFQFQTNRGYVCVGLHVSVDKVKYVMVSVPIKYAVRPPNAYISSLLYDTLQADCRTIDIDVNCVQLTI